MGPPNVGKSVVFNRLTGMTVSVANYAGTTVEMARATARLGKTEVSLVDVPGTYTLSATNEAEQVATELLAGPAELVIVVVDSVNIESSVYLVLQVLACGKPAVVALNRNDIAAAKGWRVDPLQLQQRLGVPVVATVAVNGHGIDLLRRTAEDALQRGDPPRIALPADDRLWPLAEEITREIVHPAHPADTPRLGETAASANSASGRGQRSISSADRRRQDGQQHGARRHSLQRFDSQSLVRPWPGLAIAAAVLLLSFSVIVGVGMGLRRFLLLPVIRGYLFPAITGAVTSVLPPGVLQSILIGEYGLLIKGIEWPFALVLPYVLSFYLAISLLEDSGYLPRFAVLLDGALSRIGLRGSHSISLLLGYGCAIPGILSTRAMGSRKERVIVATLISLAVPCISQTGALFALLAEASIWLVAALFALSFAVMIVAGMVMDRLVPGQRSQLVYELPELLMPRASVTAQKLVGRTKHYLLDGALPMVVAVGLAAVLYETGLLALLGQALAPLVTVWLRLPQEAAVPLLLGLVRRELTVLPLLDLPLSNLQLFVGATVGLFYVPCIAVVATLSREFGLRTAGALLLLTTATAFALGGAIAQIGALL